MRKETTSSASPQRPMELNSTNRHIQSPISFHVSFECIWVAEGKIRSSTLVIRLTKILKNKQLLQARCSATTRASVGGCWHSKGTGLGRRRAALHPWSHPPRSSLLHATIPSPEASLEPALLHTQKSVWLQEHTLLAQDGLQICPPEDNRNKQQKSTWRQGTLSLALA